MRSKCRTANITTLHSVPSTFKVTQGRKEIQEEKVITNVNLTLDSRLEGSGFDAHSLTGCILHSRNLKNYQPTDKSGLQCLSLLPVGPVTLQVQTPPRLTSYE